MSIFQHEKIAYEYIKNEVERKKPYCDYEYRGISEWRYGYVDTPAEICRGMIADIPFSSALPPVRLKAKVKRINWEYEDGFETVCAKMPNDTTPIGEEETIHLYPYGCAKLRMTELPVVE